MRQRQIFCEYQPYTMMPPVRSTRDLYAKAASNDGPTIDVFAKTWIDHARLNKEKFGDLLATINIEVPKMLTNEERKLYEQLAEIANKK